MSLFTRPDSRYWQYEFKVDRRRFRGSTGQLLEQDAKDVEATKRLAVRRAKHGLEGPAPVESPHFQDWAETYFDSVEARAAAGRLKRPGRIEDLIRVALRFWGRKPAEGSKIVTIEGEPYHDLRLTDVITDPSWITKWETWLASPRPVNLTGTRGRGHKIERRHWSEQTKNQYRSLMSQMLKYAMSPEHRLTTGITINPFAGLPRGSSAPRDRVLDIDDLQAILSVASFHLRVAIAIGVLAPKFREGNILSLRWDTHFSKDRRFITVKDHKTAGHLKRPLVVYVPDQLHEILIEAEQRADKPHVITYQGKPVHSLRGAVRGAIERARAAGHTDLTYGRAEPNGITFHTLRHTAATLLAELDVSPEKRQQFIGHTRLETTMRYTHLRPAHERDTAEALSAAVPIKKLVLLPGKRPNVRENVSRKSDESAKTGQISRALTTTGEDRNTRFRQ
jgi:integrase